MHILKTNIYKGRNIYSHKPVIKMELDLKELYNTPTKDIPRFNESLLNVLPGLKEHYCSTGIPGGFVQRLNEGTYLAHVTEHITLELQHMLGYEVSYGKAREIKDNIYYIVYEFKLEECGTRAGRLAVEIVNSLIENKPLDLEKKLNYIKDVINEAELGPSTKAIADEAKKRNIPVTRIGSSCLLRLGYGKYQKLVEGTLTENASCISVDMACDKILTKNLLSDNGIPVAAGDMVYSDEDAVAVANEIGYPIVIKPLNGNQGKGVCLNLKNDKEVRQAFNIAKKVSKNVMVEKNIIGRYYRVLVVKDKVAAVSERIPAHVIGNGINTIKELVDFTNSNPDRGEDHERPLTKIKIDDISKMVLLRQGYDENSIVAKGKKVYLRDNDNLSTGGISIDATDIIHPENVEIAIRAVRCLGLDVAGVDIVTTDITKPLRQSGGVIIEINASPGIRMHHYPQKGKSRNVSKAIIDMLFPEGHKCTIPIVSVTGTNGKTTTTRMIGHILNTYGYTVGMTTTDGLYIDNKCIMKGDNTGPVSAATILSDKSVEAAVLETARGGIIRAGLGYDLSDVGIITNVTEDHLGINNINTLDEMVYVKSLVVEAVKENGYAVLNADDMMTNYIEKRVKCNIIYFSANANNIKLIKHISQGGAAVYLKEDVIIVSNHETIVPVIDVSDIPATMNGLIKCNIQNSLAAVAGCYALKIPVKDIAKGLTTFYCDQKHNPGRFNIFNIGSYRIMVDYGHNKGGYKSVIDTIQNMGANRLVGIIGAPGDRLDSDIRRLGQIAGSAFDVIYIKEDTDLRGRESGAVAEILQDGIEHSSFDGHMEIILSEVKALEKAMLAAQPGDLIVIFYEKYENIVKVIENLSNVNIKNDVKLLYEKA